MGCRLKPTQADPEGKAAQSTSGKARKEKPTAELSPNFKIGMFILVPIAPGFQLKEIQSISGYFEVRTVFLSIPDLCHPLNKGIMALWLKDHLIAGSRRPLKLAQLVKKRLL